MSRYGFNAHVASDKRKWILVTIAIILLTAFTVLIVLTNLFTDWNRFCLFGHTYEDGAEVCSKCGKELLIEVEPDEPADEVPDEPAVETPEDNVVVEPEEKPTVNPDTSDKTADSSQDVDNATSSEDVDGVDEQDPIV